MTYFPAAAGTSSLLELAIFLVLTSMMSPLVAQQNSSKMLTGFYSKFTNGYITDPWKTIFNSSFPTCASICSRQKHLCYAFSLTNVPVQNGNKVSKTCKIAFGDPGWVKDANSNYYIAGRINSIEKDGYKLENDGRLYKYFASPEETLRNSFLKCMQDKDATLASPYPKELLDIVMKHADPSKRLALGIRLDPLFLNWTTVDGLKFVASTSTDDPNQNWATGQPMGSGGCVVVNPSLTSGQKWRNIDCGLDQSTYTRVCRRSIGYFKGSGGINKYYKLHNWAPQSHAEADNYCKSEAGRLASLYSVAAWNGISGIRQSIVLAPPWQRILIAGSLIDASRQIWQMPDGTWSFTVNKNDPSQKWAPGEPTGSEYCLALVSHVEGLWVDVPCTAGLNENNRFICEIVPPSA